MGCCGSVMKSWRLRRVVMRRRKAILAVGFTVEDRKGACAVLSTMVYGGGRWCGRGFRRRKRISFWCCRWLPTIVVHVAIGFVHRWVWTEMEGATAGGSEVRACWAVLRESGWREVVRLEDAAVRRWCRWRRGCGAVVNSEGRVKDLWRRREILFLFLFSLFVLSLFSLFVLSFLRESEKSA